MATVHVQKRKREKYTSYVIQYKNPATGRLQYYKTVRKKCDADRIAHELRATIDTGKAPAKARKLSLMHFKEVKEDLLRHWENRLREGDLRAVTVNEYTRLASRLEKAFGKRLLCEITTEELREYRNQVSDDTSKVNANRQLFVLKQIFKHGKELGAVQDDPVAAIKKLSEKQHERKNYLMPSELDALIEAARKTKAKYYLPALICLGAEHGASRQEALSLKLRDLDLDYDGIGLMSLHRTKNGMDRTQFLMPRTREALREWLDHLAFMRHRKKITPIAREHVFVHLNGSPIQNFSKAWREACQLAGQEGFHFHDLRHTYCSNLRLMGADLHDVKEMIGHHDLAMTDRYAHIGGERKFLLQRQLAEHYAASGNRDHRVTHRLHLVQNA